MNTPVEINYLLPAIIKGKGNDHWDYRASWQFLAFTKVNGAGELPELPREGDLVIDDKLRLLNHGREVIGLVHVPRNETSYVLLYPLLATKFEEEKELEEELVEGGWNRNKHYERIFLRPQLRGKVLDSLRRSAV